MVCYKVTENDIKNKLDYNTKDFYIIRLSSPIKFEGITASRLAELVQDGKTAVFPVYAKCEVREIKNYLDGGFTCYLLSYKDYKAFEKYYKSL